MNQRLSSKLALLILSWLILFPTTHAHAETIEKALAEKIIHATRFDDIQTLKQFAQQGGDVNLAEPDRGESLLMICIRENSAKVFEFLLQHPKINLDNRAINGDTALMLAAYLEQKDLAQRLIKSGAQVNQTGWTALHYAAVVGNHQIMTLLLEHHAYIDAETPNKTTPLMLAARRGEMILVKLLIEEGADIALKNMLGWSAYDFAVEAERRDITALLRELMQAKNRESK
nr:ankyrin repeat domain-containing protein [uncultured Undibacterium sp.]